MSASVLKWLALITMAADHLGLMFFPDQTWIRMVGRISFPIFAFLLVQGFLHTKSRLHYGLRLLLFALISEVPYDFVLYGRLVDWKHQSILTELLLGFLALMFLDLARKKKKPVYLLSALLCIAAAPFLYASYGLYGVCLIAAFYLLHKYRGADILALMVLTWVFYGITDFGLAFWGLSYSLLSLNSLQMYAVAACIPLAFYSGKRGCHSPKWFFYCFYPLHLLAYWAVKEQLWMRLPFWHGN